MPALSLRNLTTVGPLAFGPLMGFDSPGLAPPGAAPPVLEFIDLNSTLPNIGETHSGILVPHNQSTEKRDVIGHDDRVAANASVFPFSAIGIVESKKSGCTGFLVGPRHVATAGHCWQGENEAITFSPGFNHGKRLNGEYTANVARRPKQPPYGKAWGPCVWAHDFMILVLSEKDRIGDSIGYFRTGLVTQDLARMMQNEARFKSAGYPSDLWRPLGVTTMFRQEGIKITDEKLDCEPSGGPLIINADMGTGQSGSPVWLDKADGNPTAYGVMSGWMKYWRKDMKIIETMVASGTQFFNAVEQARRDYP